MEPAHEGRLNQNPRIKLNDSFMDIMIKLGEGHPGALSICMKLFKETETIDPRCGLGCMHHLCSLDTFGIYGSRIWMLYKDVCDQDMVLTIAALRATQLGIISCETLNTAVDSYGKGSILSRCLRRCRSSFQNLGPPQKLQLEFLHYRRPRYPKETEGAGSAISPSGPPSFWSKEAHDYYFQSPMG